MTSWASRRSWPLTATQVEAEAADNSLVPVPSQPAAEHTAALPRCMALVADLSEQELPGGLSWHEAEAVPLLADYECSGCGFIRVTEVVVCSCGFTSAAAGGLASGVTTVTLIGGHVAVHRGR
jgi:hypothetical protein